jgi:hypothetical protein
MRVAMIIAVVLVSATPSEASKSCMTKAEAREHFGSVHIYWHGPNRCWDATPTRRYSTRDIKRKTPTREVTRAIDQPKRIDQPKWRDSMSEMLASSDPVQSIGTPVDARRSRIDVAVADTPWIDRWTDIEAPPLAARWVDIAPGEPPPVVERKAHRLVRPPGAVLVFILFVVLALATIEVLLGGRFYQWRQSGRMRRMTWPA